MAAQCARIDRYHSFVCRQQTTTNHCPVKRQVIAENDIKWWPMKRYQYIDWHRAKKLMRRRDGEYRSELNKVDRQQPLRSNRSSSARFHAFFEWH